MNIKTAWYKISCCHKLIVMRSRSITVVNNSKGFRMVGEQLIVVGKLHGLKAA